MTPDDDILSDEELRAVAEALPPDKRTPMPAAMQEMLRVGMRKHRPWTGKIPPDPARLTKQEQDTRDAQERGDHPQDARNRRHCREYRDRKRASSVAAQHAARQAMLGSISKEHRVREARALVSWMKLDGKRQAHLRSRRGQILTDRFAYICARQMHGRQPKPKQFRLFLEAIDPAGSKDARNRLVRLINLIGPDGPWQD